MVCIGEFLRFSDNTEIIRMLLVDGRIDPSTIDSDCLQRAVRNGNQDIIQLLLLDGRADPNAGNNECLRQAISTDDLHSTLLLLHDSRVIDKIDNSLL